AEHICNKKAEFTQGGGARPYGVAMIIGSVDHDNTPRLFVTDPVGTYWGFLAAIIGKGTARAGEYLEKHYTRNKSLSEAIEIALGALREASDTDFTADNVEIAKIPLDTRKFQKLTRTEIEGFINPPKPSKTA
ncbi:MAG: proteasome subunit alpha, partial [Candidatus Thorarchaeota archaeon]|nr:proteasome subunit alpha [Candidatus Thorarchaeota archaeon]